MLIYIYKMPKRGEPTKQIVISPSVHERFLLFREYSEPQEQLLIKIMDMAQKYKNITDHRKKRKQEGKDA